MSQEYSVKASADVIPPNPEITAKVKMIQRETSESPFRLQLSLVNNGHEPQQYDLGYTPPFSRYVLTADNSESALILVPPNYSGFPGVKRMEVGGTRKCWNAKGVPEVLETGTLTTLGPNEKIGREYILLNHPENTSCFPAGRYSCRDTITIDGSPLEVEFVSEVNKK